MPPAFLKYSLSPRSIRKLGSLSLLSMNAWPISAHALAARILHRVPTHLAPPHVAHGDWTIRTRRARLLHRKHIDHLGRAYNFVLIRQVPILTRSSRRMHKRLCPGRRFICLIVGINVVRHMCLSDRSCVVANRAIWRRELSASGRRSGRCTFQEMRDVWDWVEATDGFIHSISGGEFLVAFSGRSDGVTAVLRGWAHVCARFGRSQLMRFDW